VLLGESVNVQGLSSVSRFLNVLAECVRVQCDGLMSRIRHGDIRRSARREYPDIPPQAIVGGGQPGDELRQDVRNVLRSRL